MSSTIQQYIPLKEVIWMYSEAAKQDDTKYLRLWRMAFRGFIHLGYNSFWQVKTTDLPVNENRTVTLPDDYIIWTKVGQMLGNEITLLKNNQGLLTATNTYEGVGDIINNDYWFSGHSRYGCSCSRGNIDFKIVDGAILLGSGYEGDTLLLEYLGAPEQDDDYAIPMQFTEAMIAWLALKDIELLPATNHIGNNTIVMRQQQFRAALKLAKKMHKPFRYSQVQDSVSQFNQ